MTNKEQGGSGGNGEIKDMSDFTVISEKKVNEDGSFIPTQIKTNREELIHKLLTKIAQDYTNYNIGVASIFERLENELPILIEQIRKSDMERVAEKLNSLESENLEDYSCYAGGLISKEKALSIIKQAHETIRT